MGILRLRLRRAVAPDRPGVRAHDAPSAARPRRPQLRSRVGTRGPAPRAEGRAGAAGLGAPGALPPRAPEAGRPVIARVGTRLAREARHAGWRGRNRRFAPTLRPDPQGAVLVL